MKPITPSKCQVTNGHSRFCCSFLSFFCTAWEPLQEKRSCKVQNRYKKHNVNLKIMHMDMRKFSRIWFNTFVSTHKNYIVCYWQICQKCISALELIHITCWARVRARMHIKTLTKFQFPKNLRSFSINDFEIVLFNETHKNQNVNKPSQSTSTIKKILLIKIQIMNEVHAFQFVKWQ